MDYEEEWDRICKTMVDNLLDENESDDSFVVENMTPIGHKGLLKDYGSEPGQDVLHQMVQLSLEKLRQQKDGSIRKSELGGFLRYKIGKQYQRGWLRVVLQDMNTKGLLHTSPSDMVKGSFKGLKWCHFLHQCKYLQNIEANKTHFKLFVHICPQDQSCSFLNDHRLGKPMTQQASDHFQHWKHKCLQGPRCGLFSNPSMFRDHLFVYTHRVF